MSKASDSKYYNFNIQADALAHDTIHILDQIPLKKKRTSKNGHLRLMTEEYGRGEYSGEQLAVKYFCWRVHATKGNTRNMVEATDRKFNKMLEPYGLQLKIVHCDRGKIHWRVMPVYLKEGDNGTDNIPAC